MRPGFYEQTARVENEHWWFVNRRRLIVELLERFGWQKGSHGPRAALDVGCGTGGNLSTLQHLGCGSVVGLDRSETALKLAREKQPGAMLVQAEAGQLADCFEPGSFDLVCMLNVLYHRWIESEAEVLDQANRLLAPEGWLVVTEPAFPFLYRRHDRLDHGARRYRRESLERLIEKAGLRVAHSTYFNLPAFVPAAIGAFADRMRAEGETPRGDESGELVIPPAPINRLMLGICAVERKCIGWFGRLRLGVGLALVARKNGGT